MNYVNWSLVSTLTLLLPMVCHGEPSLVLNEGYPITIEQVRINPETVSMLGEYKQDVNNYNSVRVVIVYNDNTDQIIQCSLGDFKTTLSYYEAWSNPEDRLIYSREMATAVNNCRGYDKALRSKAIQWFNLYVPEGRELGTGRQFPGWSLMYIKPEIVSPIACSAFLTNGLEFGTINIGTMDVPNSTSYVQVQCDSSATITMSVNEGKTLVNDDGSVIAFDYEEQTELQSGVSKNVLIRGKLVNPPRFPGSYKWYTTIKIFYD
ncbi:hypothetical protein NMS98_001552 [Vibrio cholerae]|nr:hypothetical protein [Vibrio cholerae]